MEHLLSATETLQGDAVIIVYSNLAGVRSPSCSTVQLSHADLQEVEDPCKSA